MSTLNFSQKQLLEKLFDMNGGYVLNFSNRTFSEFIQNAMQIDIYSKYEGLSKAKILRDLFVEYDDKVVGKLIIALLEYMDIMELVTEEKKKLFKDCEIIANKLMETKIDIIKNYQTEENGERIFVSYSWDSQKHKENVLGFVDFLRRNGFNATYDQDRMQEQTAIHFGRMMVEEFYKSDKIIVVLSKGYAKKANEEHGGVGIEYNYIISEIRENPNKYILVSFERLDDSIIKEITPVGLMGRDIVDLKSDQEHKYQKLFSKLSNIKTIKLSPVSGKKPEIVEVKIPEFGVNEKAIVILNDEDLSKSPKEFFEDRISKAFPGVRGIKWFTDAEEIVKRLAVLLKNPLKLKGNNPIWWFRGTLSMQIENCYFKDKEKFLMDTFECLVDKICVYRTNRYDRSFIYVELKAEKPIGVYEYNENDILREIHNFGYAKEEYGIFKDYFLTREEYDDGAKFIDGELVTLVNENAELRCRFLSRYNFIICALFNPINSNKNDSILENYLNDMLNKKIDIKNIIEFVEKLPRIR